MLRRIQIAIFTFGLTAAFAGASDQATSRRPDAPALKQRYEAFVASLNHRQLAADYPGAVRNLDSPDPKRQIVGIKTLAAADDVRAIAWIVPLLDSDDHRVRIYAGQALNAVVASHELKRRDKTQPDKVVIHPPGPDDVDLRPVSWVILKMLRMPDDGNTHAFAANMIGYLVLREYEQDLRELLTSRHPAVTQAATRALEMLDANARDAAATAAVIPIQNVDLDLSRLRGWGTRSFTYQVERGGERTSLVPSGWSVHRDGQKLVISRDQQVEFYNTINLPRHSGIDELRKEGFIHKTQYRLTLRFGRHITREQYSRLVAENAKRSEEMAAMRERMRHIDHKFDSYLPDTPEEKRLVDTYYLLKESLHDVPDYFDEEHSIWVSESLGWACAFASGDVGKECKTVRDKVLAPFQAYNSDS